METEEEKIRLIINECYVRFRQEEHSFEEVIKFAISEAKIFLQPDVSSNGTLPKSKIKKKRVVAVCRHEWDGGMCRLCGEIEINRDWRDGERQTDC